LKLTKHFKDNTVKHTNHKDAFTLIELMIVVVIIGILATIAMPKIMNKPDKAKQQAAKSQITLFNTALANFNLDTGRYPTTTEGLSALVVNPGIEKYDEDGYMSKIPKDPWGNDFIYIGEKIHNSPYTIESYGKDGEDGGSSYNTDIESWNF